MFDYETKQDTCASESSSTQNTREDEDTFLEKRMISLKKKQKTQNKKCSTKVTTQEVRLFKDKRIRRKCLELV